MSDGRKIGAETSESIANRMFDYLNERVFEWMRTEEGQRPRHDMRAIFIELFRLEIGKALEKYMTTKPEWWIERNPIEIERDICMDILGNAAGVDEVARLTGRFIDYRSALLSNCQKFARSAEIDLLEKQAQEIYDLVRKRPVPTSLVSMLCNMTSRHTQEIADLRAGRKEGWLACGDCPEDNRCRTAHTGQPCDLVKPAVRLAASACMPKKGDWVAWKYMGDWHAAFYDPEWMRSWESHGITCWVILESAASGAGGKTNEKVQD